MSEPFDPDITAQIRERFERSFYFACKFVFEAQFHESWLTDHVHKPLCDFISDPIKARRAGVVLPRGWLKSQVCSIYYPVWRAMLDPNFTCMIVQNTFTNATKKMSAISALLKTNKLLAQLFPERMLTTGCQSSAEAITLPRSVPLADSTFSAAGVGTDVTGRHVDLIVEDDTVAPEYDQMSETVYEPSREQVAKSIGLHRALHFILNDFSKSQRIVVGTRWRDQDLLSHIETNEPEYVFVNRAVREDKDGNSSADGDVVYPERFGEEALLEIYNTVGDYMYQALMMSDPLSSIDCMFSDANLGTYESVPANLINFTTVDLAPPPKEGKVNLESDYNTVVTTGMSKNGIIYVRDYFRERCNPGEVSEAIFDHVRRHKPYIVGIEGVGYQSSFKWWIEEQQRVRGVYFAVEELKGSRIQKTARIKGLEPLVQARKILLGPTMHHLRQEFVSFPHGKHDDLIDALAYQLQYWRHAERIEVISHASTKPGRRTGAWAIESLTERVKRADGFPYDVMGQTQDGRSIITVDIEQGVAAHTESFIIGEGISRVSYNYSN